MKKYHIIMKLLPIEYKLQSYERSNQDTSLVNKAAVDVGTWVQPGDMLADNVSSQGGEFSIGQNLLIAYMPWEGYNYEDAILISERLVYDDLYTSIHIEKYDIKAEQTSNKKETITRELPNLINSNKILHLDKRGIVKVGTSVKEGDILVGKITPITETIKFSGYEKLFRDIMGYDSNPTHRDSSLRVPKGLIAKVIRVQILRYAASTNQVKQATLITKKKKKREAPLLNNKNNKVGGGTHSMGPPTSANKMGPAETNMFLSSSNKNKKKKSNKKTKTKKIKISKPLLKSQKKLRLKKGSLIFLLKLKESPNYSLIYNQLKAHTKKLRKIKSLISKSCKMRRKKLLVSDNQNTNKTLQTLSKNKKTVTVTKENKTSTHIMGPPSKKQNGRQKTGMFLPIFNSSLQLFSKSKKEPTLVNIYLAQKRKIRVGDKMAGRHGNKGIVSQILPRQDMPYLPDGRPLDLVLNPLGVPSRMNVGQIFECLLGLAGHYLNQQYRITPFDERYGAEASRSFVFNKLYEASLKTKYSWIFQPNHPGKIILYDGRNGEYFNQPITVGQAYIIKLVHLVDDKIHSRSTGPYSLVTQQPLRGRSKQGGQRVGEMEVWAIEGYGAAFTLLELLSLKSDDIIGRATVWDSILHNKPIQFGTPASFNVLVSELNALCLNIGIYCSDDYSNLKKEK
nr:RNA polymerase beta subunit protein b [Chaetopeltis orbicularis]